MFADMVVARLIVVGAAVIALHAALLIDAQSYYDDELNLKPHDQVAIQSAFLAAPNATTFVLGEPITILLAVQNSAETSLLMEGISAHLHSPFKYHNHIQNFTMKAIVGDIASGQTKTFAYRFRPHVNLLPISYRLAVDATYRVDGEPHLTTFYNQTISLSEKPMQIDTGFVIQASIALIGAVVGVIALMSLFKGKGKSGRRRTASPSLSEWLPAASGPKQKAT